MPFRPSLSLEATIYVEAGHCKNVGKLWFPRKVPALSHQNSFLSGHSILHMRGTTKLNQALGRKEPNHTEFACVHNRKEDAQRDRNVLWYVH